MHVNILEHGFRWSPVETTWVRIKDKKISGDYMLGACYKQLNKTKI